MSKAIGKTLEPLGMKGNGCLRKKSELWCIDSKLYDLRGWYGCHPGGADILEKCCGLEDLTPMFESYHAFGNISSIRCHMSKFEYVAQLLEEDDGGEKKNATTPPLKYSFLPDGMYAELKREVRGYFMARKGRPLSDEGSVTSGTKATTLWGIKVAVLLHIYVLLYFGMLGSLFNEERICLRVIMGLVAGGIVACINYCVLHDDSHYAIFGKDHGANGIVDRAMCAWSLWNHCMWTKHHVYGHHSFTGDPRRDPDIIHARPFIRKNVLAPVSEYFPFFLKWQHYIAPLFMMIFPGQSIGQTISYYRGAKQGHIWGIPCLGVAEDLQWYEWLIYACSMWSHMYGGNWLCSIAYFMGINVVYHVGIFADHDTYETAIENSIPPPSLGEKDIGGEGTKLKDPGHYDWGEIQVRHSGNFVTSSTIFTQLFGGINYQIEHHLFPSVSHMHYPAISEIVKRVCISRGVPYSTQPSIWAAYSSYVKLLKCICDNDGSCAQ